MSCSAQTRSTTKISEQDHSQTKTDPSKAKTQFWPKTRILLIRSARLRRFTFPDIMSNYLSKLVMATKGTQHNDVHC